MKDLPKKIAIFPLSNFIIFPNTSVPLNIFEPRYLDMVNDSMQSNKLIGMIQPNINKKLSNINLNLHKIGCLGRITSLEETNDGRYLIELKGVIRFEIIDEIKNNKKYRECNVRYDNFYEDLNNSEEDLQFSDLELILRF